MTDNFFELLTTFREHVPEDQDSSQLFSALVREHYRDEAQALLYNEQQEDKLSS